MRLESEEVLTIKSTSEGLEFWVRSDAPYSLLHHELENKLGSNAGFYKGAGLPVIFFGRRLNKVQKRELTVYLRREFSFEDVTFSDEEAFPREEPREKIEKSAEPPQESESAPVPPPKELPVSKFLIATLRNGQRIECEGDVTIIGDVNPGSEVVAAGNVAVMGRLRGLVHAGARGDVNAVIVANYLLPQQIRIASRIAIIPKNRRPEGPEIVKIEDGNIVVDSIE